MTVDPPVEAGAENASAIDGWVRVGVPIVGADATVGAAVVVVTALVVVGDVDPAAYAPPEGGPAVALSASHDVPEHAAAHTRTAEV